MIDTKRSSRGHASHSTLGPYVAIARLDHWFKNGFMLLGVVLALSYQPGVLRGHAWWQLAIAVAATCLIASSNYVLNEILDAPHDRHHPLKCSRPVPSGLVSLPVAYAEWILLAIVGGALAWTVNWPFFLSAAWLWVMGVLYNVPPIRTKEWAYVDVLSESINNPIRLLLGWFALVTSHVPPASLAISYWMAGAMTRRFMYARAISVARSISSMPPSRWSLMHGRQYSDTRYPSNPARCSSARYGA